jgi:CDP-diacylglycerol---serine O-phosphatidyltransferase
MGKRKPGRRGLILAREMRRRLADRRREMAQRSVAVLPTFLTLGNAVCGFGAITFAGRWTGFDTATSMFVASCLIFAAMIFDSLDGSTARRLKQTSEFGAQLDSLCDAISFGAAPALLMLQLAAGFHPRLLWMIAALYVACTVLRLARYNVESDDAPSDRSFSGLPSPAAAGTVASFPFMVFGLKTLKITEQDFLWEGAAAWLDRAIGYVLPPITLLVACLMVSRVRYPNTVHYLIRGRRNGPYLIKLVFAVALIFVMPQIAVPLLFGYYAFAAPAAALWRRRNRPKTSPTTVPTAEAAADAGSADDPPESRPKG